MRRFQSLNPKRILLVLGLVLIGAGLLLNEWGLTWLFSADGELVPRSVVIIWIFDLAVIGIGLLLVLTRSLATLLNVFIGLGLTALLIYGAERLFYRLNQPAPSAGAPTGPRVWHEGDYTQDFFRPDQQLGYTVRPDAAITSIKKIDDRVVYDVVYSIDEFHRRITPVGQTEDRTRFLLFFGDSFTFGEGVSDNETLPFYVGELAPKYKPYNYRCWPNCKVAIYLTRSLSRTVWQSTSSSTPTLREPLVRCTFTTPGATKCLSTDSMARTTWFGTEISPQVAPLFRPCMRPWPGVRSPNTTT